MRRAVVAAVLAVLGLVACGGDGAAEPVSILVAGDSYSSGNGAGDYADPDGCRRSGNAYGTELEALLEGDGRQVEVDNVACSGAMAHDVVEQAGAVEPAHDVIVLSVGGNDAGFGGIVASCLVALTRAGDRCDQLLSTAEADAIDGTLEAAVREALEALQAAADDEARIILLGYPYLEADAAFEVDGVAAGARLRALGDAGDEVGQTVAEDLGARFVSLQDTFAGHELRAAAPDAPAWFVNPLLSNPVADWYHPNAEGHAAIADLLADVLD